jgi:hypothetical protein
VSAHALDRCVTQLLIRRFQSRQSASRCVHPPADMLSEHLSLLSDRRCIFRRSSLLSAFLTLFKLCKVSL